MITTASEDIIEVGRSPFGLLIDYLVSVVLLFSGIWMYFKSTDPVQHTIYAFMLIIMGSWFFLSAIFYRIRVTRDTVQKRVIIAYTMRLIEVRKVRVYNNGIQLFSDHSSMLIPGRMARQEEVTRFILDRIKFNTPLEIVADEKVRKKFGLDA